MRFSVVIPTLGRTDPLRETLDTVLVCDPPPTEVVIVDGDEQHAARPLVEAFAKRAGELSVRYVPSARGVPRQRQACIEAASGDVVVFVDDDALLDPGLFRVLGEAYEDPDVVGATGQVIQAKYRSFGNQQSRMRRLLTRGGSDGKMTRYGYPRHLQRHDIPQDVEFMQGCLMSARREAALRVGFDLALGGPRAVALLEDEDFSYRLSRLGRVRHLPEAVVHHMALGFHGRDAREYSRLIVHDRAYLLSKNFSPTRATLVRFWLLIGIFFAHRIVNREWKGVTGLCEGIAAARREGYLRPASREKPATEIASSPELS